MNRYHFLRLPNHSQCNALAAIFRLVLYGVVGPGRRWFTGENPIKMDDLGVRLVQEPPISFIFPFPAWLANSGRELQDVQSRPVFPVATVRSGRGTVAAFCSAGFGGSALSEQRTAKWLGVSDVWHAKPRMNLWKQ